MQTYEINYLVLQSKTSQLEKIRESIKNLLVSNGAEIAEEKDYLKRKLAYEVKHESHGFFTVLRFKMENSDKLEEIKKNINLNLDIPRSILVKADGLPSLIVKTEEEEKGTETEKKDNDKTIRAQDVEKVISQSIQEEKTPEKKEEKETEKTPAKKEENEKPAEEPGKEKGEPSSLEDLDKKLDEILNI